MNDDHTFSVELPVNFGENNFNIVTTDEDGNSSSIEQKIKSSDRGKTTVKSSDVTFDNGIKWGTSTVSANTKNYDPKTGELTITGKVRRPTTTLQIDGKDVKINSDQTFEVTLNVGTHGAKIISALIGDSTVRETTQERLTFYVDAESPVLTLDDDGPVYINKDKYTISGTVTDDYNYYGLSINGNSIESAWGDVDYNSKEGVKKDFKYEVELKKGKNTFNIKVTDAQGNETTQALVVYYEPEKTLDEPDVKQTVAEDAESALLEATTKEPDAKVVYSVDGGKTFKDMPADGLKVTENGTVEFKAVDKYGNESDVKSVEVKDLNEKTNPSADDEKLSKAKEKLQAIVDDGEKKDLSGYTDDSKKAYEEALDKAKEILTKDDATLEDVKAATDVLDKADKGLTDKEKDTSDDELPKAKKEKI